MPIPWISLHRWMFGPLYLFISLPPLQLLFTHSVLQSVSFLSSAIHCVSTEHSFPWSSLLLTHPFMRCDGATAPNVSTDPGFLGLIKEVLLNKVTAFKWEQLTIDQKKKNNEKKWIHLQFSCSDWLFHSPDPHNSGDLHVLENGVKYSYFYYMGEGLGLPHKVSSQNITWTNDFVEHKTAVFPIWLSRNKIIKIIDKKGKNDELGFCMRWLWTVMPSEIHFKCYNLVGCALIM